jgi:alkanesulfonate monooxygenase SsuD/methylene tetrahydromethanopterin reductase-like flavin-dependent oxidoreductase (luciferase family)
VRFHAIAQPITPPGPDGASVVYDDLVQQALQAEALGLDGFWVSEHHFGPYGGAVPLLGVMLAYLAARTDRIRLGAGSAILSLRPDAVATAEEFAMVDRLSGGRLELGMGRGFLEHEFDAKGIDFRDRQTVFERGLSYLERVLGGQTDLTPPPLQRPIPTWVAVSTNPGAPERAARGGHGLMLNPYSRTAAEVDAMISAFKAAWRGYHGDTQPRILAHQLLFVAQREADLRRYGEEPLNHYLSTVANSYKPSTMLAPVTAKTFQQLYPDRLLFGTPDTVSDKLRDLRDAGITDVTLMSHFRTPSEPLFEESLRLFATEVAPQVTRSPA